MKESNPVSLLVRNLRYTTSPDRVRQFFERFGEVRDVYLPLDFYTKLPRGFGFVEFAKEEDADVALDSLSRQAFLDGSEISVTVAQQGRKSPDTMRARDRHGSGGRRVKNGNDITGDNDDFHRKRRSFSDSRERCSGDNRSRSRSHGNSGSYNRYHDGRYTRRYSSNDDDRYRKGTDYRHKEDDHYPSSNRSRLSNDKYREDRSGGDRKHREKYYSRRDYVRCHVESLNGSRADNNEKRVISEPRRGSSQNRSRSGSYNRSRIPVSEERSHLSRSESPCDESRISHSSH